MQLAKSQDLWETAYLSLSAEERIEDCANFQTALLKSAAKYKGEVVLNPFSLQTYTSEDLKSFNILAKNLHQLQTAVVTAYLQEPEFRSEFAFDPRLENLILHPVPYREVVPIMRADVLYKDATNYHICEINTDGSSAMTESPIALTILAATKTYQKFIELLEKSGWQLSLERADLPILDCLLVNYRAYLTNLNLPLKRPNILIIDYFNGEIPNEFRIIKEQIIKAGYVCEIADVRQLNYVKGELKFANKPYDLIYRRAVTVDYLANYDASSALTSAYLDDAICLVGSFKTQLIHSKKLFALLKSPYLQAYLTNELKQFISLHIPETAIITPDLLRKDAKFYEQAANYVIKPADSYAGKGVALGINYCDKLVAWRELLNKCADSGDFLIQKYIPANEAIYWVSERKDLGLKPQFMKKVCSEILGIFIYNGEYIAPYLRLGKNALVTGGVNDYTAVLAKLLPKQ